MRSVGLRASAGATGSGWELVLDDAGRPRGWTGPTGERHQGGTLYTRGDSLRQALDAALSSPSGLGVAVDADGRAIGLVSAQSVLDALGMTDASAAPAQLAPTHREERR